MGGGNEEEISPSDESNSVSHFVYNSSFQVHGYGVMRKKLAQVMRVKYRNTLAISTCPSNHF